MSLFGFGYLYANDRPALENDFATAGILDAFEVDPARVSSAGILQSELPIPLSLGLSIANVCLPSLNFGQCPRISLLTLQLHSGHSMGHRNHRSRGTLVCRLGSRASSQKRNIRQRRRKLAATPAPDYQASGGFSGFSPRRRSPPRHVEYFDVHGLYERRSLHYY